MTLLKYRLNICFGKLVVSFFLPVALMLPGCGVDNPTTSTATDTADFIMPAVTSTTPANAATGAATNISVTATFSEAVNPATVNTSTFTVAGVTGTVTYNGTTATFTPAVPLAYSTLYTATITTGVKDFANNPINSNYSWSFTTAAPDFTPPTVSSTVPANAATNADINNAITVTFSEAMDSATITTSTFTLMNGAVPVSGAVTYSGTTATFTPAIPLTPNTPYAATITTGVKDLAGNQLVSNYSWSFTTVNILFTNYISIPTGSWPEAVAIGDVNGDGRNDVVMTTGYNFDAVNDYKVFVFLQNAAGGLNAPVKYATSSNFSFPAASVSIGDINQDGKNDVAIGISGLGIEVFTQNAGGSLNPGVVHASSDSGKIRIADMNNDGRQDIVGIGSTATGSSVSVWLQNATGTLNAPASYAITAGPPTDLEIGDINNDGLNDIVAHLSNFTNLGVLTQIPGGTFNAPAFYSVAAGTLTNGVAVGDVNGDNLSDVVVTYGGNSPSSKVGVFPQNALGTLDPVVSYTSYDIPEAVEIADVTGDGRKDVIVLHGGWNALGVYRQLTNGILAAENLYTIPYASHYNPHGLAVGDINGDGNNDAVIADYNSGLVVLYHY